jgi:hypothetical protein
MAAACLVVSACSLSRVETVPVESEEKATVMGMSGIRFFADGDPAVMLAAAQQSLDRERADWAATGHSGPLPPANFLAISGGGENGAYGAGLLVGWTKAGNRPTFKVVTGISTGALTAPFAFLGPAYDQKLTEVYTKISGSDVLTVRNVVSGVLQDAMADNSPLRATVAKYVDQPMLDAIEAEYKKGRLLLVATTDLDARRPVIWNIGEIALRHNPGSLQLVRDVLVASAGLCSLAVLVGLVGLVQHPAAAVGAGDYPPPGSIRYVILRDGDQIGSYEMDFARSGSRYEVRTRTDISVSFLGIVLYRLGSSTDEVYVNGQLQLFHATSNDDGNPHEVMARRRTSDFDLVENGVEQSVSGKLLPGTLWHPATLTATELIDPFDCKRNKVSVSDRGMEQVTVRGQSMQAHHVSIMQQRPLEVWYASDGHILTMSYHGWDGSLITTELR